MRGVAGTFLVIVAAVLVAEWVKPKLGIGG